jgi:hypothetical protein
MLLNPHKYPKDGVDFAAHNAMAAMLRCQPGDSYALAPFAPLHHDGQWWVAATYGQDDILLIDGKSGAMRWLDDAKAVGFWGPGDISISGKMRLFSNGILLARAWAAERQANIDRLRKIGTSGFEASKDAHHMPGLAMIGDPTRIGNFADISGAHTIEIDNPRLRHVLSDAILRAAKLPVVVAAPPPLKVISNNG